MRRSPEDIQDELLVLRCQGGDGEAMTELIRRWDPRLNSLAWRLTGGREAAHDLVQDTWIAVVRGIRRLDDPARFRSWACRIVANKCADWTRRRVVRRRYDDDARDAAQEGFQAAGAGASSGGEADALRAALVELPQTQAAILALHYLEGMGIAEIADVLSIPQGTVKSRLDQARNRLRAVFERARS